MVGVPTYFKDRRISLYLLAFLLTIASGCVTWIYQVVGAFDKGIQYYDIVISDWMINYQGGFVRRGFVGELLYQIYEIRPYCLPYAIIVLYHIGFAALTLILIRMFRRRGWSCYLLPFPMLLFYNFVGPGFLSCRRDSIVLCLTCAIFYCYRNMVRRPAIWGYVCLMALSVLIVLTHEASFFFTFPILMLHTLMRWYRTGLGVVMSAGKTFLFWFPIFVVMVLVYVFNGNEDVTKVIWASWNDCMQRYPTSRGAEMGLNEIGVGVRFLEKDIWYALSLHTGIVWKSPFLRVIPIAIVNVYVFAALFYLLTRLNTISLFTSKSVSVNSTILGGVFMIQFAAVFPLFGFLSCDMWRTIPYLTISTLFFYYFFDDTTALPRFCYSLSGRIQCGIDKSRFLTKRIVYFMVLVTLPVFMISDVNGMFPFIPYHVKEHFREYLSMLLWS